MDNNNNNNNNNIDEPSVKGQLEVYNYITNIDGNNDNTYRNNDKDCHVNCGNNMDNNNFYKHYKSL